MGLHVPLQTLFLGFGKAVCLQWSSQPFLLGWRLHGFSHLSGIWPPKWHFGRLLVGWAASEFSLAEVGVLIWSLGHFELATTSIKFVW